MTRAGPRLANETVGEVWERGRAVIRYRILGARMDICDVRAEVAGDGVWGSPAGCGGVMGGGGEEGKRDWMVERMSAVCRCEFFFADSAFLQV